jgi:hypothetical protein
MLYQSLAAAGAPPGLDGPEVGPLGGVGLAQDDRARAPEPAYHAGVAPDHGPQQRERAGRRVQPVARGHVVLDQDGDAVHPAEGGGAAALRVGARRLAQRVRVHLDDGAEQRVEPPDLVQVEPDQRRGRQAPVPEPELDGVHGGLVELEAAGGYGQDGCERSEEAQLGGHAGSSLGQRLGAARVVCLRRSRLLLQIILYPTSGGPAFLPFSNYYSSFLASGRTTVGEACVMGGSFFHEKVTMLY